MASCSSSDDFTPTESGDSLLEGAPSTEVYVGVDNRGDLKKVGPKVRAASPLTPVENVPYFAVKVDPRLGYNTSVTTYYPAVKNGMLYTDCPFLTEDDTPLVGRFMLSTDGTGLRTLIAAGDTATASVVRTMNRSRTNPVSSTVVEENIHVIWYMAKDIVSGNGKGWHIDGLLTDKEDLKSACEACENEGFGTITFGESEAAEQLTYDELVARYKTVYNIKPIDKALGVDIHQQEHKDWGEIKTSIHLNEAKDVKITLPVGSEYTVEGQDMGVVVKEFGSLYNVLTYNENIGSEVNVTTERLDDEVVITVTGVSDELIKALERRYNSGLTIEVHTFYTQKDAIGKNCIPAVWSALRQSTVTYDGNVKGQITTAFDAEDVVRLDK